MSDDTANTFIATTFLSIIAVVIAFLIVAAIKDGEGRKDWQHYSALPVGVEQIDEKTYLVDNSQTAPSSVCSNSILRNAIDASIPLAQGKTFVRCHRDQKWNDHRTKSVNFSGAMAIVISSPRFDVPSAVFLLFVSLIWVTPWRRERHKNAYKVKIESLETVQSHLIDQSQELQTKIDQLERINSSKCECGRVTNPNDYMCPKCRGKVETA